MTLAPRASLAAAFAVALASAILALSVASALVLGGAVALAAATLVAAGGGAVAWHLALRARARHQAARSRSRLARLGLLAGTLVHEVTSSVDEVRELLVQLRDQLDEQPAWAGTGADDTCDLVAAQLDRIDLILRDFLASARPEPSPPRIVDVSLLLRAWIAALEPELAARDVALVAEGLAPPATAVADPDGLKQIVWSLARNARDAAPRGSIVRLSLDRDAERVRIRIADRGPGIPREDRDSVFEPLVSTKPDGTGLGLAVALRLAEAMGATLSVVEGPPGATLELALRRAPPSARLFGAPADVLEPAKDGPF